MTIVVLRERAWHLLEQAAAWLALAQWVVAVCDLRDADGPPQGMTEEDVLEVRQEERRELAARLGQRVTFLDVRESDEGAQREAADALERTIGAALREAEERAAALRGEAGTGTETKSGSGSGSGSVTGSGTGSSSNSGSASPSSAGMESATGSTSASPSSSSPSAAVVSATESASASSPSPLPWPVPLRPLVERRPLARGPHPWLPWRPPGAQAHRDGLEEEDALRHLAASLCWPAAGPALLDAAAGERLDLQSGNRTARPGLGGAERWRPIAAHPDGDRWLRGHPGRPTGWSLDGSAGPGARQTDGWGSPIGIDPGGLVAWTGGRCRFSWRVLTERGPAFWTPSNHAWPSGHGKKLYGYEDNDPLFVQLSADGTTCLSVYEHDALITPGVPLRWRSVDTASGTFALAERARGEPRALLFERSDDEDGFPGDPYEAEEDARDRRAVVTLGPSPQLRYAVGLHAPVYRLAAGKVERIDGACGGAGWAVFDEQHQLVRCGRGRLLCGWDRWLHLEEDGQLRREDLLSGERLPLGAVDRPVVFAHALVGSGHAVLLARGADGCQLRLV